MFILCFKDIQIFTDGDRFITLDKNIYVIHSEGVNILYFSILHENICYGYSLEASHVSHEYHNSS